MDMVCAAGEFAHLSVAYWLCHFEDRYMYADGGGTLKVSVPSAKEAAPTKDGESHKAGEEGTKDGKGETVKVESPEAEPRNQQPAATPTVEAGGTSVVGPKADERVWQWLMRR